MRDFPIFTTDFGVSSLVLREIPYKNEAYICIRTAEAEHFQEHLEECVKFCTLAGAERVYAAGHPLLEKLPLYTTVLEMRGGAEADPEKVACIFPVTEQTVAKWRQIYNEKMRGVDNSRTLEARDEKEILSSCGAYFVHSEGTLLGIGWLSGNKLLAVASVVPGAGERIMHTLMSAVPGESMVLEVASSNHRALRLYDKLGFLKVQEISRWYAVT